MKKTVLVESAQGVIFRADKIPNSMFNFYLLKSDKTFKDGTNNWKVCVEYAADTSKHLVLDTVRGTKKDAERRLDELLSGKG